MTLTMIMTMTSDYDVIQNMNMNMNKSFRVRDFGFKKISKNDMENREILRHLI